MKRFGLLLGGVLLMVDCGGGGGGSGPPMITAVVISGDSTVVLAGTRPLTATAMAGGSPLTTGVTFQWSSADTTRATVSNTGVVSGVRLGTTAITARAVLNGTPTAVVSPAHGIRTRIGAIVITPPTPQFPSLGESVLATAEARDFLNAAVPGITFTWQSRATSVATATARTNTAQADVVAIANGTARIVVTGDGVSDSVTATVRQVATTLALTPDTVTFGRIDSTLTPVITGNDARGNPVSASALTWTSQTPGVATVNPATGVIQSKNEGQSRVVATSGSLADTVRVGVDQIPATVTITPANFGTPDVRMVINSSAPFFAAVRDSGGALAPADTVIWSTDNAPVANVSSSPSLDSTIITTGASAGTATITATAAPVSASRVVVVDAAGVSYNTSIRTLLNNTCASAACHGATNPMEGLNLTSGSSYTNLVERASMQVATLKRVRAFRPDSSYMVHKIQGTQATVGGTGERMPEGCSGATCLSDATINLIRNWILQGALNN